MDVATLLASFAVFLLAVGAMSIGVWIQGRQLRGSCGGSGGDCQCSPLAARRCPLRREREART
jgi:hypothetical protein